MKKKINLKKPIQLYSAGIAAKVYDECFKANTSHSPAGDFSLRLKELCQSIFFSLSLQNKEELQLKSKEIELLLNDFMLLIKKTVDNNDVNSLNECLNELNQIENLDSYIRFGSKSVSNEKSRNAIEILKNEEIDKFIHDVHKNIIEIYLSVYSYILYYKYYHGKIDNEYNAIISVFFDSLKTRGSGSIITAFMDQIDGSESEIVSSWLWNIEKRLNGVTYIVPSHFDLYIFGLFVYSIKTTLVPPNSFNLKHNRNLVELVATKIIEYCEKFKSNQDWVNFLEFENIDSFNNKLDSVKTFYEAIKNQSDEEYYAALVNSPIEQEYVDSFKRLMITQWQQETFIDKVFENLKGIEINPETELKRIGFNVNMEKSRMMFVKGEYHANIYNIDFGRALTTSKETHLASVLSGLIDRSKSHLNLKEGLSVGIDFLLSNSFKPNLIIINQDNFYRLEQKLIATGSYLPSWKENIESFPFKYRGIYDGIPVISIRTNFVTGYIFICDVGKSLILQQRENEKWVDNKLSISVKEINDEDAELIYSSNAHVFKDINKEKAMIKIKSGMILDMEEICDFVIKDKNGIFSFIASD